MVTRRERREHIPFCGAEPQAGWHGQAQAPGLTPSYRSDIAVRTATLEVIDCEVLEYTGTAESTRLRP